MQSLNSFQYDRDKNITNPQVDTTVTKQNVQNESESSLCLLNNKRNDISSPEIGTNIVFKPFAKLIYYFHIVAFVKKIQRYLKPDGSFMDKHFEIIGDKGAGIAKDFLECKQKKTSFTNAATLDAVSWKINFRYRMRQQYKHFQQQAERCFNQIPLIEPNNKIKLFWDILLNFLRVYMIFIIPIIVTFENLVERFNVELIVAATFFLLDMGLRTITIYFDQGLAVKDRFQILHNQINSLNIIQISGIFCMLLFAGNHQSYKDAFVLRGGELKLTLLLVFCEIQNILSFINNLSQSLSFGKATSAIIELVRLIGVLLILQHLSTCIWIVVGRYGNLINITNWIEANQFSEAIWSDLYIQGIYFISVSMFTVGYGDVHPENNMEKVFVFFFVFICAFQTSYSLNTIGHLLQQIKKDNEIINRKMIFINQYMQNKKVSNELQLQIREYLQYYWYQEQMQQTSEQINIINQLSEDLRKSLAFESNVAVFKQCGFLTKQFSQNFQNNLLQQLSFQSYQPSTYINTIGENDQLLHIIDSGEVNVYEKRDNGGQLCFIGSHKQGECFSIEQFFDKSKQNRLVYKSAGFVSTLAIPLTHFFQTLQNYPEDLEKYWDIKTLISSDQLSIRQCVSCDSNKHQSDQCRQVHYIPDREKVLKSYTFNQIQDRTFFVRNRNRQKNYFKAQTDAEYLREACQMIKAGNDSAIFQKWQDFENQSYDDSKPTLKVKPDLDSISLLIKDFDSKNFIPDPVISENKLLQSASHSKGINSEEFGVLQILNSKLRNKTVFDSHDIDQMEMTIKRLEMQYSSQVMWDFDQYKEYKAFNTANNISTIIKRMVSPRKMYYKDSHSFETCQLSQASYWLKYMLRPFDFINQYRAVNRHVMKRSDKVVNVQQRQRKLTKVLYQRRIERKWIFRKALQVHPAQ